MNGGWIVCGFVVQFDEEQKGEAGDEHARAGGDVTDDLVGQHDGEREQQHGDDK